MKTIKRAQALREYDIKDTPEGKQVSFSIRFCLKSGEMVFLPRAVATGLKANMSKNRLRGVIAIDERGDPIGHVYPVGIDNFIEWNDKRVIL
jgi:hypothetical protein